MEESLFHCYHEMIPVASFSESPLLQKEEQAMTDETNIENLVVESQMIKSNRIQRIFDIQHKLNKPKQSYKVELELSIILLREMKINRQLEFVMLISILVDSLIRLNSYIYLFLLLVDKESDGKIMLYYLLLIPRFYFFLSLIRMLFRKLHLYRNQPILMIIVLFRQNFTNLNMIEEASKEWYDWRNESSQFNLKQLLIYLLTPNELSYFLLKSLKNGVKTYIVTNFILKTIEIVMFTPIMLILLNFNEKIISKQFLISNGYEQFTLVLIYIDGIKYIFFSIFYLTKRNYQINKI
ncbi:unnamed protein product (macronuclear) [Paramecium tetraurelia]|uniref:Uncharacterized protein n=1 Tax=Paramecium tetraurelia TaxID=5888 RepID=A0C4Z4_PARTE|nr:uncharacterized protein GSPATT00006360001 [Paramecium tetraurelia]CAK65861.1 unnamed protein product [Paramecium tetraurelia]|eukprot:XP_001433258.1 hypothetical protein (macronuclear) [Paramecium tetraurelia strain d4-2]